MNIASELEKHTAEELKHAISIAKQIDYLGDVPTATAKQVKVTEDNKEMLRADLHNEIETILIINASSIAKRSVSTRWRN